MNNYDDVNVRVFYQGKEVKDDFFKKNPALKVYYPDYFSFLQNLKKAKKQTKDGMVSYLDISENDIEIKPNSYSFDFRMKE
jgi:hypothetical protein